MPEKPPRRPTLHAQLAPALDALFQRYHTPDLLGSDPLVVVRAFTDPADREIAAFFAAMFAYGRVPQINASLARLFALMDDRPAHFVRHFDVTRDAARFATFVHRFATGRDVLVLTALLQQVLSQSSLEQAFHACVHADDPDFAPAWGRFRQRLISGHIPDSLGGSASTRTTSFKHLVSAGDSGAACKRVFLFLRWMARPDDGIDLGLWPRIGTARLLMPVDTHVLRVGRRLGLIRTQSATLAATRELTRALARIDPIDPVRFDFALCRLGILGTCPTNPTPALCDTCNMQPCCPHFHRVVRRRRATPMRGTSH